ncbi:dTDP-4-dehydrorhamnose reductase [Rhodococcus sp. AD45-ID]|uniref:dTDP-4-dehydrorhamnose reductase n=1 Tax=Rhodococcus TaxID=1827 RepID=UPI0005D32EA5|nr:MULTISPECIES: dTDP-4-dehydrorhamnose reductase [unclassified Rhodococcus (in: high G+C Gram-positive bacteria)]KJF20158.1 dTDP-4-dehydrorhamnose reductase [Rhodococcus sp. AD45]PSR41259.1 dTDP-4-dehydrorhamnose reductase [Rhodococcus sp. AD45-ID]
MTNILLTGARGQLGSRIESLALSAGRSVVALGSAQLDITDRGAVDKALTSDVLSPETVVINCAAYTAVDAAESDEAAATAVNETGPSNLASACARAGARLIHVSTDYVFPGDAHSPYEVDSPTGPSTVYGRTKLAGEEAVRKSGADSVIVRTAWVYSGETGDFVGTMRRLEGERDFIDVVDDQIGSPTYSVDLAAGLLELASRPFTGTSTLHATNDGQASWFDLARAVFEEIGADPNRVRPCTSAAFVRPAPRPAYSVLSGDAWAAAGLSPLRPWREALHDAIA